MYYEEVDLCRRIQASGHTIHYWPELRALHIGGESAKTVKAAKVSRAGSQLESWRMRSGFLYYRKHHGGLAAWSLYRLEHGWFSLRSLKARWSGKPDRLLEFHEHRHTLYQAWRDTHGGRHSPSKPW